MADNFSIKISADVREVEKGFESLRKSIDKMSNKKLGIKMEEDTKKIITGGVKDIFKDFNRQYVEVRDRITSLSDILSKAVPDTEEYRKTRKEILEMANLSIKLKQNLSEASKSMEQSSKSGFFTRFGKGVGGVGRDVSGLLGRIPVLGKMMGGGAAAGGGFAGMLGGAAGGLGLAAIGAAIGEGVASYGVRKGNIGATVGIGALMGTGRFQAQREQILTGGAKAGFMTAETLRQQENLLRQMGTRNVLTKPGTLTELQKIQRGFGVDVSQSTNFLGAVRRGGGKADTDTLRKIIEDGMKGGIDKADLPKYLEVIAEATERASMAGEINQAVMSKTLQDLASRNEFFRNNPQAMGAGLEAAGKLFGAGGGLRGAFATTAAMGSTQGKGMTFGELQYEKMIAEEQGLFGKGIKGIGSRFAGGGRIEALQEQFKQLTTGITDPRQKARFAKMLMPEVSSQTSYSLLSNQRLGKPITKEEQEKITKEIREGRNLQNLKGEDFKALTMEAQKEALRDTLGGNLLTPMNKVSEATNAIRGDVSNIAKWLGKEFGGEADKGAGSEENKLLQEIKEAGRKVEYGNVLEKSSSGLAKWFGGIGKEGRAKSLQSKREELGNLYSSKMSEKLAQSGGDILESDLPVLSTDVRNISKNLNRGQAESILSETKKSLEREVFKGDAEANKLLSIVVEELKKFNEVKPKPVVIKNIPSSGRSDSGE